MLKKFKFFKTSWSLVKIGVFKKTAGKNVKTLIKTVLRDLNFHQIQWINSDRLYKFWKFIFKACKTMPCIFYKKLYLEPNFILVVRCV